jgi:hypothetical protein
LTLLYPYEIVGESCGGGTSIQIGREIEIEIIFISLQIIRSVEVRGA